MGLWNWHLRASVSPVWFTPRPLPWSSLALVSLAWFRLWHWVCALWFKSWHLGIDLGGDVFKYLQKSKECLPQFDWQISTYKDWLWFSFSSGEVYLDQLLALIFCLSCLGCLGSAWLTKVLASSAVKYTKLWGLSVNEEPDPRKHHKR